MIWNPANKVAENVLSNSHHLNTQDNVAPAGNMDP